MSKPLAYFLTWTTYGTWLPGDGRGWVHKRGSARTPYREPDSERERRAVGLMPGRPARLDDVQRRRVDSAIRQTCRAKGWLLHALNVRTNHVHVVLSVGELRPERVMVTLKAWASRSLNAAAGRRKWWTRHGSTRYLNSAFSVARAIEYVRNQ
jgi:REP element-mobilizing transposase RayT